MSSTAASRVGLPDAAPLVLGEQAAPVPQSGQRIDHCGGLVDEGGALLGHRHQDEGDGNGEQQRLGAEHSEPDGAEQPLHSRRVRQHHHEGGAEQE
jgi:hypothetical protein